MSFYEKSEFNTIEKATLAAPVSFGSTKNGVKGKFFIKILTPSLDFDQLQDNNKGGIIESNYVELTIPGHLLIHFMGIYSDGNGNLKASSWYIPKGTEFLIEILGGVLELDKIQVVGVYSPN